MDKFKNLINLFLKKYPQTVFNEWDIFFLNGYSGRSFLVQLKNTDLKFFARFYEHKKWFFGTSKRKEWKILKKLNNFFSPNVFLVNKEWLILEWCKGNLIDKNLFYSKFYKLLVFLLSDLHYSGLSGYSLDLKKYFLICWNYIDYNRVSPVWLKLHHFFQKSKQPKNTKKVISHLDIHLDNVFLLDNRFLKLVDWEYAIDCDLCFDFAFLFLNNNFSKKMEKKFFKQYCLLNNIIDDFNNLYKIINLWKPWVYYAIMMWYEVRWMQTKEVKYLNLSEPIKKVFNLV